MIHMIMGEQKLPERSGGPAICQIVEARIDQGYGAVEFDHAATGATAKPGLHLRPTAGRAVTAVCRYALRAAGACQRNAQTHQCLTAFW
ncbi:hypothetical protein SARI_03384 [Salmonella enterica subsp. arizonae serovar 62:z4,z23:-]|uniref:Uncharacterized protein n=1 Tax=Salmonella arizonae (strain ATCC BAA-731 / CDC346-86 / RSK2980) TaxID=41514 RepID=A9MGJ1_SALAR|nr:hypothetical protein SARI_03384 [Salmonella enterica subsp. arizonae serovar 62:z4,z23:-]